MHDINQRFHLLGGFHVESSREYKQAKEQKEKTMIAETTTQIIKSALAMDANATDEEKKKVMKALSPSEEKVKTLSAKEVCEMLNITRRTLGNYVSAGKLRQINYTPRKIRFLRDDVVAFATGRA